MAAKPSSPSQWKQFLNSYSIPNIPNIQVQPDNESLKSGLYIARDVYLDATAALSALQPIVEVHADVLAFPSTSLTINLQPNSAIVLSTRVITADAASTITLVPPVEGEAGLFIYASQVDKPCVFTIAHSNAIVLDIEPARGVVGMQISFKNGVVSTSPITEFPPIETAYRETHGMLLAQLRIASLLFWLQPTVAVDIAAHVSLSSLNSQTGAPLTLQANALAQQLALTTSSSSADYAPSLTLGKYEEAVDATLQAALAFEQQYTAFTQNKLQIKLQEQAWTVLLQHTQDEVTVQNQLTKNAQAKFQGASDTLNTAVWSLRYHQIDLNDKKIRFQVGIEKWKLEKKLEAAAAIIFAVAEIAISIGLLCVGDPAPAAAAPAEISKAVKGAAEAAKDAGKLGELFKKEDIEKLKGGLEAVGKLWESTEKISGLMDNIQNNMSTDLPAITSEQSAADASGLAGLAAWDAWTLDVDAQMAYAVDQGIEGASEYKLELQKHAIDSKLVIKARSEAIKAGQEYANTTLNLWSAVRDLKRMQDLLKTYDGELEKASEAQAAFYDRMMLMKTNALIELRDAVWAYQYLSLLPSSISLNPLRSITDLQADKAQLVLDVKSWLTSSAKGFSVYNLPHLASDMALSGQDIIKALRDGVSVGTDAVEHKATFTLVPQVAANGDYGPFHGTSHVRTKGLRVYLVGIKPKDPKRRTVEVLLTPSGVFQDSQSGKIFHFTMDTNQRDFSYDINQDGKNEGEDGEGTIRIDSFSTDSNVFADITPFSQWTIKLLKPENYDLSGLSDVKLVWRGIASFADRQN